MADFEPPSFSLGLDLCFDSEPESPIDSLNPKPLNDVVKEEDEEEFGSHVVDSDPESGPEPIRVLKRLRRGLPKPRETTLLSGRNVDDDIEDFSSEEDVFEEFRPSTQYHSMCSSSKVPLNGFRAVTKSLSECKEKKTESASDFFPSASTVKSHREKPFPKPTVSPLRRFQLIDSDSDDSSKNAEVIRKGSELKPQREDLWKDFTPINSFRVSTPTLDELCEEYFRSVKGNNPAERSKGDEFMKAPNSQSVDPIVPAHRYFLSSDPRIRKFVRDRLPNFYPLGVNDDENVGNLHKRASSFIDYMGQFGNKEASKQVGVVGPEQAKRKARKRGKNSTGETSSDCPNWVDPKLGNGSQRSRARKVTKKGKNMPQTSRGGSESVTVSSERRGSFSNGQSGGQWFTANGRKVYMSKNGQELTGQMAYRQYKRDRGGNGKAKRKTSSKKKKN